MLDSIVSAIKGATGAGVALMSLAIVLQIIFGGSVPFVGGDIIGTITGIVHQLGAAGLVGLITVAVLYKLLVDND